MSEPVLTRCPRCGREVRADPERGSIECPSCAQVFSISHDPAAAPSAPAQKIPRVGLVVATIVVPLVLSVLALYVALRPEPEHSFSLVRDYFAQPETIPERVEAVGEQVRRVSVTPRSIEVYDAEGEGHIMANSGEFVRTEDASALPPTSFRVDEVDFAELPEIIADASRRGGGPVIAVTVEVEDDAAIWRVLVQSEGGATQWVYSLDGQLRTDERES